MDLIVTRMDIDRAPRGEVAAETLVASLANEDDRVERHYLEVKGPLDLNSRKDAGKVAKFILGAANRSIALSQSAFEGTAMVIGVVDGEAVGVAPIEVMELARMIERYIGVPAVSPRWDIVRVPVSGSRNDVLVALVEQPVEGQPVFVCLANGEGLLDGAIYMRADGETRQATADEVKALIRRATAGGPAQAALGVMVDYSPVPVGLDVDTAASDYITVVREYLTTQQDAPVMPDRLSSLVLGAAWLQEDRTQNQLIAEINRWESRLRESLADSIGPLIGQLAPPVVVTVTNDSDTFLREVQVIIHLEGEITGAEYDHAGEFDDLTLELPPLPRRWGRRPNPAFSALIPDSLLSSLTLPPSIASTGTQRTSWDNSGSVTITLDIGDLRPRSSARIDDEELVLWLPETFAGDAVRGTWKITAADHHRVYSSGLDVAPGTAADLTDLVHDLLMRRIPKRDDSG